MEDIKCFLITMGIGFAIGAMVTATNKKVSEVAKKAQTMAVEKLEKAKEGIANVKEKIEEKIEEAQESEKQEEQSAPNNKKQTKKA